MSELKLDWKRAIDGSWFATTSDIDGWTLIVGDTSIGIATNGAVVVSTLRTERDRVKACLEAEDLAYRHIVKRYGRLIAI